MNEKVARPQKASPPTDHHAQFYDTVIFIRLGQSFCGSQVFWDEARIAGNGAQDLITAPRDGAVAVAIFPAVPGTCCPYFTLKIFFSRSVIALFFRDRCGVCYVTLH